MEKTYLTHTTCSVLTVNYPTQRFSSLSENNKDAPSGFHVNTRPPMGSLVTPALTCPPMDSQVTPALTCPPVDSPVTPALTCPPMDSPVIPSGPYPSLLSQW